jgi:redox-sensitive bicupin YhaK (pirin superfamily)
MNESHTNAHRVVRPRARLAVTDLGWVRIHDHFVQTVGPASGKGEPLGDLLVLADAVLAPHARFPLHSHAEMEIVSIVLAGDLTHYEAERRVAVPRGAAQIMSARSGIVHAEGNETANPVRMLQIWLRPNLTGDAAVHEVAGPFELGASLKCITPSSLRQDATISMARVAEGESLHLHAPPGRALYAVCVGGEAEVGEERWRDGDGLMVAGRPLSLHARSALELVVIDIRVAPDHPDSVSSRIE